jgi:DNA-binding XRE family transcriptional regulator
LPDRGIATGWYDRRVPDPSQLPRLLRSLRDERGLTRAQLAARSKFSVETIRAFERGWDAVERLR